MTQIGLPIAVRRLLVKGWVLGKMKALLILFGILLPLFSWASDSSCQWALADFSITKQFMGFIEVLHSENALTKADLQKIARKLELGQQLPNPFDTIQTETKQSIYQQPFQNYLDHPDLDLTEFKKWLLAWLSEVEATYQQRQDNALATTNTRTIVFHPINSSFSLMETQMTQWQYARLQIAMGESRSFALNRTSLFDLGEFTPTIVSIEGVSVRMQPNHPENGVEWSVANKFVQKLNEMSLDPNPQTQAVLKSIITDHHLGDQFDLPSREEWAIIESMLPVTNKFEILRYAWLRENSGNTPHPVAEKEPRIINGHPFYDLEGNLRNCLSNAYATAGRSYETSSADPMYVQHLAVNDKYNGIRLIRRRK